MVTRERFQDFFNEGEAILEEMIEAQKIYYSQYVGSTDEAGYYNVMRGIDLAIIAEEDEDMEEDADDTDDLAGLYP